jgi:CheY-like chemotaxis protein
MNGSALAKGAGFVLMQYRRPVRLRPLVLVIDNSGDTREVNAEILRQEGIIVTQASSGEEGLRTATESLPDVVITDLPMPVMDGWETIRA